MDRNVQTHQIADNYNPIPEQPFVYNLDSAIFNEQLVDKNYGNGDKRVSFEWNRGNEAFPYNLGEESNYVSENIISTNPDLHDISVSEENFQYFFNENSTYVDQNAYFGTASTVEDEAVNTLTQMNTTYNGCQSQFIDDNLPNNGMVMTSMDGEIYALFNSGEINTENPANPTMLNRYNAKDDIVNSSCNMQSSKEMMETVGNEFLPPVENICENEKLITIFNDQQHQKQQMDSELLLYSLQNGEVVLYSHASNDAGNCKNIISASSSERLKLQVEDCNALSVLNANNNSVEPCLYISQDNPDDQVYVYSTGDNDTNQDIVNSDGIFGDDTKVALMDNDGKIVGFFKAGDHEVHDNISPSNIRNESIDSITEPIKVNKNEWNEFKELQNSHVLYHNKTSPKLDANLVSNINPFGQITQSIAKSEIESIQLTSNNFNFNLRSEKPNCISADVWSKTIFEYEHNLPPNILLLHPLRTRKSTARMSRADQLNKPFGCTVVKDKNYLMDSYLKQFDKNLIKVSLFKDLSSMCTTKGKIRPRKALLPHLKNAKCYVLNINQDQLQKLPKTGFCSKTYLDRYTINANIPEINEIFSRKKKNNSGNCNKKYDGSADSGFQQIGSNQECINSNTVSPQGSEDEESDMKKNQFKCSICSKIFISSRSLSTHQNICTAVTTKDNICVLMESKPIAKMKTMDVVSSKSNESEDFPTAKNRKFVTRLHSKIEKTRCDRRNVAHDDKTP